MPPATHYRPASCAEIECEPFTKGWATRLDKGTQQDMIDLLKVVCAGNGADRVIRPYKMVDEGVSLMFIFQPGTPCFRAGVHKVPLEREPFYIVRRGDWRVNLGDQRIHANGEDWVDDFAANQDKIKEIVERG